MPSIAIQAVILTLITAFILVCSYVRVPFSTLQQSTLLLLVVGLLLANHKWQWRAHPRLRQAVRWLLIYLCILLVQMLVVFSGSLYSPFLVLVHFTTLGLAFAVSGAFSLLFLGCAMISLIGGLMLDPVYRQQVLSDPGTAVLYGVSFIVIVPIALYIAQQYRLKADESVALSKQLNIEDSILGSVREYVFITDPQLNILSANPSVEQTLSLYITDILHQPLLDHLVLKDVQGRAITAATDLAIPTVLETKQIGRLQNLRLFASNRLPQVVQIETKPVLDADGHIEQLIILISEQGSTVTGQDQEIEQARLQQQALAEHLHKQLLLQGLTQLSWQLKFMEKLDTDIDLMRQLQANTDPPNARLTDVANLCRRVINQTQYLSQALGVECRMDLTDFHPDHISPMVIAGIAVEPAELTGPYFTAPIDDVWLNRMIEKLLEQAIFSASQAPQKIVHLSVTQTSAAVQLELSAFVAEAQAGQTPIPMQQYRSGLEPALATTIAAYLNLEIVEGDGGVPPMHRWTLHIAKPTSTANPTQPAG